MTAFTPREWVAFLYRGVNPHPGHVEFRFLPSERKAWMPWPAFEGHPQEFTLDRIPAGEEAYMGMALRRNTANGKKENCQPTHLQWVDLDLAEAPSYTGGLTKATLKETDPEELREYKTALLADALEVCARYNIPPRAVVDSGHGLHLHWTRRTTPSGTGETEPTNAKLAALFAHLGADSTVKDLSRIMRLPGGLNLKNPARPLPVQVIYIDADAWVEHGAFEALPSAARKAAPATHTPAPAQVGSGTALERYVQRALAEECGAVASAGEGGRNDALNRAAFNLGTLVGAGVLDELHAAQELSEAARAAGLEGSEVQATVRSGLGSGKAKPRDLSGVGQKSEGKSGPAGDAAPAALTWGERQPLPAALPPAPTLPPEMLPPALRGWLVDLAELACVPLEGLAASALAALSGLIGRAVQLAPEGLDNSWRVVPNLWGALVQRPSGMKSMQLDAALAPLHELEARARDEFEAGEVDRELKLEALKMQEEQIKKDSKKSGKLDLDALRELRLEAREAAPTPRRYMVQNTTYEKLGELLRENPLGLTMVRDELSGWIEAMGREENSEPRSFWLQTWNGDGSYTFDRIGRGTVRVDNLCMAVMGAIQPGPLQRFVSKSRAGAAADVGFLQRFQLLVYPDGLPAWKRPSRQADAAAKAQALAVFETLDTVRQSSEPVTLAFSEEAQAVFIEWRDALEVRLRGGELVKFPAFESHLGKYRSLAPSLALIFHLVDVAAPTLHPAALPPVTAQALDLALNWVDFLELHARKVYAHDLGTAFTPAHALAEKIEGGAVREGDRLRDLRRKGWAGLSDEELGMAVQALSDLGWVQVEKVKTPGRPLEVLRLHPDFLSDGGGEA
ncbi:hypothetical protein GCM10008959_07390 [Deinococcus seoulensis]|uniref:DUF3987 domain-containing protein n=1 Tax=Deinococcus seoulensis TaxID=1837379 RepID=A0ABQ2RM46_9DEIO|nr:YfjI family protein [Deinococcus seoulensis]GGR48766.1 hypothetical protein GCM10008959_07390 [Deinococcus seoulensis]